jgi:hypothetical protein
MQPMTKERVLERLCHHDPRNPHYVDFGDGTQQPYNPDSPCACDNCYYGRTEMALHILSMQDQKDTITLSECVRNGVFTPEEAVTSCESVVCLPGGHRTTPDIRTAFGGQRLQGHAPIRSATNAQGSRTYLPDVEQLMT